MLIQFVALGVCSAMGAWGLRRAVPRALSNPCGFPQVAWGWPEALLTGGLVALFMAMAGGGSSSGPPPKLGLEEVVKGFALYAGLVCFVLGFLVFRGMSLTQAFGLRVRGWSPVTVLGWLLMFLPLIYLCQALVYLWSGPDTRPQPIVDFLLGNPGWRERLAVLAVAVVAAPVTEELIFRGCLYGMARARWGRPAGILLTSLVFAAIHGHAPSFAGLTILAVGLALVYERCGSLWAPILLHAGFNALTIVLAIFWPELAR